MVSAYLDVSSRSRDCVAALEDRPSVYRIALPLSVAGTGITAYHSCMQVAVESTTCTVAAVALFNISSLVSQFRISH